MRTTGQIVSPGLEVDGELAPGVRPSLDVEDFGWLVDGDGGSGDSSSGYVFDGHDEMDCGRLGDG